MGCSIPIEVFPLVNKGKRWFHIHKWVPLSEHPRGGDVSFCFMLEADEQDRVEMCLTCPARRIKKMKKK